MLGHLGAALAPCAVGVVEGYRWTAMRYGRGAQTVKCCCTRGSTGLSAWRRVAGAGAWAARAAVRMTLLALARTRVALER